MDAWIPGKIVTKLGDLHYEVGYEGKWFKCHFDQLKHFVHPELDSAKTNISNEQRNDRKIRFYDEVHSDNQPIALPAEPTIAEPRDNGNIQVPVNDNPMPPPVMPIPGPIRNELRRSTRIHRRPDRLNL